MSFAAKKLKMQRQIQNMGAGFGRKTFSNFESRKLELVQSH